MPVDKQVLHEKWIISNLISDLTGDEYAIRGLNEFKNSLKG